MDSFQQKNRSSEGNPVLSSFTIFVTDVGRNFYLESLSDRRIKGRCVFY